MKYQQPGRALSPCRPLQLEYLESRDLLATSAGTLSDLSIDPTTYTHDHILVQFNKTPHALPGTQLGQSFSLVPGLQEIQLLPGTTVEQAVAAYEKLSDVQYASPDYLVKPSWIPNDSRFADQWDMRNTGQKGGLVGADINADNAWGVVTGSRRTTVAVFDTGIDYTHPDLYQNIWINQGEIPASRRANLIDVDGDKVITFRDLNDPRNIGPGKIVDLNGNGYIDGGDILMPMQRNALLQDTGYGGWADKISQDGDVYVDDLIGWNFYANNNNPMDTFGHGTHVAGTIGAMGNNGIGVAGLNWAVQLASIRFTDDSGFGSLRGIISGLDYVVSKGIRVSNHSWEASSSVPGLFEAMKRARDAGHIIVAAAGNSGKNTDNAPSYPSGYDLDNIISVGASTSHDTVASFSNYGINSVDIVAPGENILSTNPNNSYGYRSGTSMAAPHVTGVIALIITLRPEWSYRELIYQVLTTADNLVSLNGKVAYGRLDALAAIRVPPRGQSPYGYWPTQVTGSVSVAGVKSGGSGKVTEVVAKPASSPVVVSEEVNPVASVPTQNVVPADSTAVLDDLFSSSSGAFGYRPEKTRERYPWERVYDDSSTESELKPGFQTF